jgi:hypothetical protein
MLTVLAKTGVRREELIAMDVELTSILFAIVAIVIGEAIRSWLMGQAGPNLGSILEGTVGAPISSFMLKTLSVTVASYMLQVAIVKKFDLLKVTLTAWGWAFSLIGLGLALYFAAFPPPSELDDWVAAAYGVMALAGVLLAVQALLGGGTVLMLILRVVGLLIGISGVTLAVARLYF